MNAPKISAVPAMKIIEVIPPLLTPVRAREEDSTTWVAGVAELAELCVLFELLGVGFELLVLFELELFELELFELFEFELVVVTLGLLTAEIAPLGPHNCIDAD